MMCGDRLVNALIIFSVLFCCQTVYPWFEYDRAAASAQQQDWGKATQLLKQVLVDQPDRPDVLYDAGVASFRVGDVEQARAYFNAVTQAEHVDTQLKEQAHFNLGNTQVQRKKLQEAIEQYEKVLEINPGNERAKHNLEIVKQMLEQQQQKQEQQQQQDQDQNKDDEQSQDGDGQEQEQNGDGQGDQKDKNDESESKDSERNQPEEQQQGQENNNGSEKEQGDDKRKQDWRAPQHEQTEQDPEREGSQAQQGAQEPEQEEQQDKGNNHSNSPEPSQQKEGEQQSVAQGTPEEEKGQEPELPFGPDSWLAAVLDEQEKRDAENNKKMMRYHVSKQLAGQDGQNCW